MISGHVKALLNGTSNSPDILKTLVGATVRGVVQQNGEITIIFDGCGITFASLGGGTPAYWPVSQMDVDRIVADRKTLIERHAAELGTLTALGDVK